MSKRFSLREYQESMLLRLQEATTSTQADARLGMEAGGRHWLLKLSDVAEVLPVPPIADVPLARPWFKGLANIRGNLIAVVDLQAFLGEGAQSIGPLSRLLLIQPRHLPQSSLLVGRMLGIKHTEAMSAEPPAADQPAWIPAAFRDEQGRLWQELDLASLAGEAAYLQTGVIG